MPLGDSNWDSDESRSEKIRAARAQVVAARLRQGQLRARGNGDEGGLPSLPRYTIKRELHRGGQGVVYLAVQDSTNRRVAVKILSRGPLAGSAEGLARFEREVESLSLLKHPNVVTIHDCGRDHGHVYLVMDYIPGRPLDVYVASERTPIRGVLDLFARVCDGVNAAHLRGVIHRDLKPGNILVDDGGEPHVLDFGLAKLAGTGAPADLAMTETGQFVGSMPWASPEQAQGRGDQLDIRTDVYSLGVVLYQLLTEEFPYPVTAHLVETVRHIVQTPPARPSEIRPEVDRELDTIVLKCLAKEPDRRYQSSGELARDIRRYLAGEPIEARRDSLGYVMGKQVARYRVAALGAAGVLVVVTCALVVSVSLWRRAERQGTIAGRNATAAQEAAQRADRNAGEARAVLDFMRGVLTSVEPESRGADVRLIGVLANASETASQRFGAHPAQEAEVRELLGQIYYKLSMWNEARAEFGLAAELWERSGGADDVRTIDARLGLLRVLLNLSLSEEAEGVLRELEPRLGRVPDDPRTLEARRCAALVHLKRGHVDEAERMLLELRRHPALADDGAQIRVLAGLSAVENYRFSADDPAIRNGALVRAEAIAQEWIERSTRVTGPESAGTLHAMVRWADILTNLGRFEEAAAACRRIVDGSAQRLGECHHIRANAMNILAESLARMGHDREPAELFLRVVECARRQYTLENPVLLGTLSDALRYLDRGGLGAQGEVIAREFAGSLRRLGGGHDDMGVTADLYVAHFASMQGRLEEAGALFEPLLARAEGVPDRRTRARVYLLHGRHLTRRGLLDEAEQELGRAAGCLKDIREGTWDSYPDDVVVAFIDLYRAWGKPEKVAEYEAIRETVPRS